MAKQTSHIKYKGTIGDVRHFKIKGLPGHYAGLVGGPTAEQVKTAPEFKRTRENMNEFGGCAAIAKSVRVGFSQIVRQFSDPQLTGRLTGIMKKINKEDLSEARGYRAILVTQQSQYLLGMDFNRNVSLNSVFRAGFTISEEADRTGATLNVASFNPSTAIQAPNGATHFRLVNAVSVLSDYAFNSTSGVYEPLDSVNNELSNIAYSDYLSLDAATGVVSVASILPGSPVLSDDVSVINALGIEFYQQVGSEYYLFSSGNAMKIQKIF